MLQGLVIGHEAGREYRNPLKVRQKTCRDDRTPLEASGSTETENSPSYGSASCLKQLQSRAWGNWRSSSASYGPVAVVRLITDREPGTGVGLAKMENKELNLARMSTEDQSGLLATLHSFL